METTKTKTGIVQHHVISIVSITVIAVACYPIADIIGYRSVALLLLATVSVLAIFFTVYPVLVAATVSALVWDFFFIPPHFTFHVDSSEDILMLLMYFVIALINGILTSNIRRLEKIAFQKEERQNTLKLYKTLFGSISHELRTPIAAIVGASDNLITNQTNLTDEHKTKLVSEISLAAFRLNRLVDNLLNMQRLESGFLQAKLDWCDINELINTPINRLKTELEPHTIKLDIQENFPLIKIDFGLMEQAIFNILHNAAIYNSSNTTISIKCTFTSTNVCIIIVDNGKGIPEKDMPQIFSKFYKVNQKNSGGMGLGLSIVKGFIEAHNGTITVDKNVPNGTKFTILIPTEFYQTMDSLDFSDVWEKEISHHAHKNNHISH